MTDTADATIPVALLAGEWNIPIETLINLIGADRLITDDCGIRKVRRTDAAALFEQRQAEAAARAEAHARWLAELSAESNARTARIKALQEHQEQLVASGAVAPGVSALELMMGAEKQASLDGHASRKIDFYLSGRAGEGHSLSPPEVWRRD